MMLLLLFSNFLFCVVSPTHPCLKRLLCSSATTGFQKGGQS